MALAEIAQPIKPSPPPSDDFALEEELLRQRQENQPNEAAGYGQEGLAAAKEPEDPVARLMRWGDPKVSLNIADELSDDELSGIGMRVIEETDIDENSRKEWLEMGRKALDLCLQKAAPKTSPWPNASNVIFPLMTQAADQFAARAYPAIIQNRNVVKGVVSGDDSGIPQIDERTGQPVIDPQTQAPVWLQEPGAKAARALRIGEHMSWQLVEEQSEWEAETDTLLHVLPVVGCEFRKCYYDPDLGRNVATRVSAENLIINYWAKSMETAPRLTEVISLYPYEIKERVASGFFKNHDYISRPDGKKADAADKDAPHPFFEQHRRLDLDGDGYPEPYIVTVHKDSMKVCRIVAGYDVEDSIKTNAQTGKIAVVRATHYYTKYDFMPNKEGGIYGWGFGHLLSHINISINSVLNMLIDAGTLQNSGGGFIGKGLSMHSGSLSFKPGELKPVSAVGSTIRDSIYMLDHKGPSPVLYTLLGTLLEAGKDISSVKDILSGDLKAQTMSPTVFMALVEQGLKVFTAIYKRIHRSLKDEFEKLFRLNRLYLEEQTSYRAGNAWKKITREDYEADTGIDPVSDPTMVVDAQRMARTQVLAEFKDDPLCDGIEIRRRIFEAASISDVDKILKTKQDTNPELMLRAAELELKSMDIKAGVLLKIAQALNNMAQADAKIVEPMQTWTQIQLTGLQNEYDRLNQSDGQGGPAGGSPGVQPAGLSGMAPSPDDAGGASLLPGLPGSPDQGPPAAMAQ
jgi:chaperonin GroES